MKFTQILIRHSPRFARRCLPYIAALTSYNSPVQASYRRDAEIALLQSGLYSRRVLRRVRSLRTKFIADQIFLAYAKLSTVATLAPAIDEGDVNYLAIRREIAAGRSFIFGCSYFGCMFFALLAMKGLVRNLLVVTAGDPTPALKLFNKIALASGIGISVVSATENIVALRILRQLRRGSPVATMLDCFYGKDSALYTDFLGKPAASFETLYRLGQKADAILVPTASIRHDGMQRLDIGEMIDLRSISIEEASRRVNDYFSGLVRSHPEQWMGWQNLRTRWDRA